MRSPIHVLSLSPVLALLFTLSPAAVQAQDNPAPPSCADEAHRQFDFWVGDWEVRTAEGELAGSNRVEKILNDCVVMENWEGASGSIGKSFNMYFARDETWRQTWVDGAGGRLDLTGGLEDGEMVLRGEMPTRDGGTALHEIRWTPLADGRVKQHWRFTRDGGKTWKDAFLGFYQPR